MGVVRATVKRGRRFRPVRPQLAGILPAGGDLATWAPPMIGIKATVTKGALPMRAGLRSLLPRLGHDLAGEIVQRTAAGRDVDGRTFKRRADGRPANLTRTGDTLGTFGVKRVTDTRVTLASDPRHAFKGAANQTGEGDRPVRKWAGLSRKQLDRATARVADAWLGGKR